ncbi:unnamed protein product [Mytilus coruscus]|uniref:Uncharacterized protein n=1 Tax=Mytilus coruscus TaxID=42192 RepID=A0A6J8EAY8_MYTCO|nr:unnamed protein product [Mytilus coruscus]
MATDVCFGRSHNSLHIYVIKGELDWIVNEKVSGYGDNLTLFCLIDECCTKAAGWIKFDPDYKTIYLDVQNSKNDTSKDKYAATTNSTGFSLVIKKLQKGDIDIKYSCVYGFEKSREKVLFQSDAIRDDETKSTLPLAGIIIGSSIAPFVILIVVALILKCRQNSRKRKRYGDSSRNDHDLGSDILLYEGKTEGHISLGNTKLGDFAEDTAINHPNEEHQRQGGKSFKSHLK